MIWFLWGVLYVACGGLFASSVLYVWEEEYEVPNLWVQALYTLLWPVYPLALISVLLLIGFFWLITAMSQRWQG